MLKSYEAIYENGQVKWLNEKPEANNGRVIVTFIEETKPSIKRQMPPELVGKVKILGDIISPIVPEEEWECLK